ncbi:hypothetical protein D9Q98_001695 [Chlorella vulgaris]|uniref:Uncharacterized protein n=1 Tax=Chlorella vulgaris TaxID=3077 RepID=A0A9D4TV96_CHLVU|nr:hypothetical protein D9Q98_001695 [Chlorella vulgaris]
MYCSDLRKARIYDRLEGHERLEMPRRRFAEVDGAAESLRPGAVVALAFDCDELLAARRNTESGQWSLATTATEWSSRGSSGWHTHAGDYAVESMEPDCLFRVLRDGKRIALASVAAEGMLLCAASSGERLVLAASGSGGWAGKATAHKLAVQMEEQRDTAVADARRWRQELAAAQEQLLLHQQDLVIARSAAAQHAPSGQADVTSQLDTLRHQLESLAANGGLPQLHQERARMGICLRTIKEITDLVQQSASGAPSSKGSPVNAQHEGSNPGGSPPSQSSQHTLSSDPSDPHSDGGQGVESKLRDFLGERPEQADPLYRVLPPPAAATSPESPSRRVLQALALAEHENIADEAEAGSSGGGGGGGGSAPPTGRKAAVRNPLLASLSMAMSQLAAGSPRQADGMAQFIATPSAMPLRASHPQPQPKRASPLRASQQHKVRSSFLQRPPAAMEDLYY